ncbi:MAG: glycosyltransferase family 4 protein [Thermoguttaceae bacterium]
MSVKSGPEESAAAGAAADQLLRIKYCGPVFDLSGYAEFARSFVKALAGAQVPLCLEVTSHDKDRPELGSDRELFEDLRRRTVDYRVKIINVNPDCFRHYREPGCVNIGFTMFETTRIPARWVPACNQMDGILVPSAWNREVFQRCGVEAPIRVAAPGIDLPSAGAWPAELGETIAMRQLAGPRPPARRGRKLRLPRFLRGRAAAWRTARTADHAHAFKFYSIFQWTERKNGRGLLQAYLAEFRRTDGVCLILKTYGRNVTAAERRSVAGEVAAVRNSMRLPDHAPVLLAGGLLSQPQIGWLHQHGDCFVLPHRAEGFGMPHLEAMSHGKPVIATGFSGNLEFMAPENSILLPCQLCPVAGMGWSDAYEGDMMWAEPDLGALRGAMRRVYADRPYATALGEQARRHVQARFSWSERVRQFMHAVGEIVALAESGAARPTAAARAKPAEAA